jgi:hypothetical protein
MAPPSACSDYKDSFNPICSFPAIGKGSDAARLNRAQVHGISSGTASDKPSDQTKSPQRYGAARRKSAWQLMMVNANPNSIRVVGDDLNRR